MTIEVRKSRGGDRAAILGLMDAARGEGLSAEERGRRGFVQGRMTGEVLERFEQGPGVFVAVDGGELAGFAGTSEPGVLPPGHPATVAVEVVQEAASGRELGRLFHYGPAVVDERFQGRGVLTRLLTALCRALRDDYDLGVAFVETANTRSLAVHRHYGMTEAAGFEVDGREYVAFTFAPADFVREEG